MSLFFRLCGLLLVVGLCKGCCNFPHPQQQYCEAPFVIRAVVNSTRVLPKPRPDADMPKHRIISRWPINYKYELTVTNIYKTSDVHDFSATPFVMYASFGPGFCGLPPGGYDGNEYLIYGKPLRPEDAGSLQPQLTTCGNTVPWDEVTDKSRNLIENVYGQACQDCRIQKDCSAEDCNSDDTCTWNVGTNFMDLCLWDKVCAKMEDGQCDWTERKKCEYEDVPDWMKAQPPRPVVVNPGAGAQ